MTGIEDGAGRVDGQTAALVDRLLDQVSAGVGPLSGVEEFAANRLSRAGNPVQAARRVVAETTATTAVTGFVTSFGGLLTLPLTIPADVSGTAFLNARMVVALGLISGRDRDDEEVRSLIESEVLAAAPKSAGVLAALGLGQRVATVALRRVPRSTARFSRASGAAGRTSDGLLKLLPLAGGLLGGTLDARATRDLGDLARRRLARPAPG